MNAATVWTRTKLNYDPAEFLIAWDRMMEAIPACKNSDGFQYDMADVTRQALANYARPLQEKWVQAYREKNVAGFTEYSARFLELMDDMDKLLATRKDFLLGPWIADARHWGTTPDEKNLYERNAKDLVTLWGDAASPLHEYSCRQWSGLLGDFYKPRWERYFGMLQTSMGTGMMDQDAFEKSISEWEWQWVNERKDYPTNVSGKTINVVEGLYKKYRGQMGKALFNPRAVH
jgi:alpha-N-acetylglucosaminidase